MQRKFLSLTLLLLTLVSAPLYPQSTNYEFPEGLIPNITPPSPEVSALFKFSETPVGLYTGSPNISVPLFQVSAGELSVPISMSFHSGGVRIEDVASRVGMGWSLSAGGVIGRTKRGRADEDVHGGYFSTKYDEVFLPDGTPKPTACDGPNTYAHNKFIEWSMYDTQPDLFNYSFPGSSGSFLLNHNKEAHLIPQEPIKLLANPFDGTGWIVVDNMGTKYFFNEVETTETINDCGQPRAGGVQPPLPYKQGLDGENFDHAKYGLGLPPENAVYTSSWHLSRIESANGIDFIDFEYVTEITEYNLRIANSKLADTNDGSNSCFRRLRVTSKQVSKITSSNGSYVSFIQGTTPRLDLQGGKRLAAVAAYSTQGELIKSFILNHEQVARVQDGHFHPEADSYSEYYLRLNSVQEQGADGSLLPATSFEYIGVLPERFSFDQDHWGYYNGAGNSTLIPSVFDGDREPNINYATTGLIRKVTYPTGGHSEFEYELHDYSNFVNRKEQIRNEPLGLALVEGQQSNYTSTNLSFVTDTQLHFKTVTSLREIGLETTSHGTWNPANTLNLNASMRLRNTATGAITNLVLTNGTNFYSINVTAGNYVLEATFHTQVNGTASSLTVSPVWFTEGNPIHQKQGGGLRLKSMKIHDGIDAAKDIKKYYQYTKWDEQLGMEISSGAMPTEPAYFQRTLFADNVFPAIYVASGGSFYYCQNAAGGGSAIPEYHERIVAVANSNVSLLSTSGSYVGYSEVSVCYGTSDGDAGKSTSKFTNPTTILSNLDFRYNPMPWANDELPKYGLELETSNYKKEGGQFVITDKVANDYAFSSESVLPSYTLYQTRATPCTECGLYAEFETHTQQNKSFWVRRTATITTSYGDQNNPIVSRTDYGYDMDRMQLREERATVSNSQVIRTLYSYPFDYSPANHPVFSEMVNRNMLAYPVEVRTLRAPDLLSGNIDPRTINAPTEGIGGQLISYRFTAGLNASQLIVKDKVYLLESESPIDEMDFDESKDAQGKYLNLIPHSAYQHRVDYLSYDTWGNLTSFRKVGGSVNTVIWDGAKKRTLAKVANANPSEVFYTSFEEGTQTSNGGWTGSKAQALSGNLTGFLPGDYMMTHWQKIGSEWQFHRNQVTASSLGEIAVNLPGIRDEVRIYPKDAQMETYIYDSKDRLIQTCDARGQVMTYRYDAFGRLQFIKDEDGNVVKAYHYQFGN